MDETPTEPPRERGPKVPDDERLYRAILPAAVPVWLPAGKPSSAIFHHPQFSTDIASKTTPAELTTRWPEGTAFTAFSCGTARTLGFSAHHEPEHGNDAHANVYCDHGTSDRKKKARALAAQCEVVYLTSSSGGGD